MKVILFGCCESMAMDAPSGRPSMFHILDAVAVPTVPFVFPNVAVLTIMEIENGDDIRGVTLEIKNNEHLLLKTKLELEFNASPRCRNSTKIQSLTIFQPGVIIFDLLYKEKVIANYSVLIKTLSAQVSPSEPNKTNVSRKKRIALKAKESA